VKLSLSRNLPSVILPPLAAFFLLIAYNSAFWNSFVRATGGLGWSQLPLQIGMFFLIAFVFTACLALVNFKYVFKPVLIFLFVATSAASYFMNQYGTAIDWSMVQNVAETDAREGMELLTWKMTFTVTLLGILPSVVLGYSKVQYPPIKGHLAQILGSVLASLVLAGVLLFLLYKGLASPLREHRELRFLLTPTNYIQAVNGYFKRKWASPVVVSPLGTDANKGVLWAKSSRRTVTVIIVGETARSMNFSLNGYSRQTNPLLANQQGLLNFTQVQSCGTATAVSVPCVFSALGRHQYSSAKAQGQEGLLDVFKHAGFDVRWRDNNSGCKGVCDRIQFEDLSKPAPGDPLCNTEECYDEKLLRDLPELIRSATKDLVIVLHQKGSHGPAYSKRYPKEFAKFAPVCETSELAKCSTESIVAAYDNTILYTDFIISKAISILEQSNTEDGVDTALMYFSDHGESLGEKNMYLHGAPYVISPDEQRHVPLMLWLSDSFQTRFRIDTRCLAARRDQEFSHDNVFHSALGMLAINTAVYNPKLDIFNACKHEQ
jgi:lipid A ethanolaminephosphotransferase